jgi:hypothetical protein
VEINVYVSSGNVLQLSVYWVNDPEPECGIIRTTSRRVYMARNLMDVICVLHTNIVLG